MLGMCLPFRIVSSKITFHFRSELKTSDLNILGSCYWHPKAGDAGSRPQDGPLRRPEAKAEAGLEALRVMHCRKSAHAPKPV